MSRAEEMAAKMRERAAAEANANASPPPAEDPAPENPAPKSRRRVSSPPTTPEWSGAQPRVRLTRTALNVGMPDVLRIHERLALLTARERITAQDAVADAVDQWLTAKGYPRDEQQ